MEQQSPTSCLVALNVSSHNSSKSFPATYIASQFGGVQVTRRLDVEYGGVCCVHLQATYMLAKCSVILTTHTSTYQVQALSYTSRAKKESGKRKTSTSTRSK